MAARTQVEMSTAWSGYLCVLTPTDWSGDKWAARSVGLYGLGAIATLEPSNVYQGPARNDPVGDPPALGGPWHWAGYFVRYKLTLQAPGGTPEYAYFDTWFDGFWSDLPDPTIYNEFTGALKVLVTFTVSGLYLKASVTNASYDSRQSPMDFTDRTGLYSWYADEYTEVTVAGGGLSVTGTMTGAVIGGVEIGSAFTVTGSLSVNNATTADTNVVGIEALKWDGDAVPGDLLDLYSPGLGDAPYSGYEPDWKPTIPVSGNAAHVYGDASGNIYWQRVGTSLTTLDSYSFVVWTPYLWTMHPVDAKFSLTGDAYTILYDGQLKDWVDSVAERKTWTDTLTWDEWSTSWLTEEQRSRYYSHTITVDENDDWRTTNGEDVGGANATNNDERTCLWMHPITATALDGSPWWPDFVPVDLSHLATLDVNDPEDAPSRPSLWTAVSGVTVSGANNDAWTVTASATNPRVERTLKTRYWLRLDRLAEHLDDPEAEHNTDWPLMLFPNLAIETTLDDAAWWSAPNPTYEDEWHWGEFAFAKVDITAPKAGTVTLTVNYSTVVVSDPCYTGFKWRLGDEGTWDYTRTQRTATYTFLVDAGANTVYVDLCRDVDGNDIQGAAWLLHVDKLTFALPNGGETDESWELTDLSLVDDSETETHAQDARFWRQWDWIGSRWVGYDAFYDGAAVMQTAPLHGYGSYPHSWGYMYIHHRQHNPDSELSNRLDYAEALSRLYNVLSWCRGWEVVYTDPITSSHNQDSDQDTVSSAFYWWDLKHTEVDPASCAVAVGAITPPAGVRWHCYHTVFPRGELTGLLYNSSGVRIRSATGGVKVYSEAPTTFIAEYGTDNHGRWVSDELLEDEHTYTAGTETGLTVGNREYSLVTGLTKQTQKQPDNAEGYVTDKHIVFADEGNGRIYIQTSPSAAEDFGAPRYVSDGTYPWVTVKPQGDLILCKQSGASILFEQSRDGGYTWAGVGQPVTGQYPVAAEYNGVQYLVSYTSGVGQVIRRSQTYFSTLLTYGSATSALITASTDAERAAFLKADSDASALCVVVPYSGDLVVYRSVNDGETWTS